MDSELTADLSDGGAYAELHAHSAYSFAAGAASPEQMVHAAAELGYTAVGLLDVDGMYSAIQADHAGRALGMPIVHGAELTLDLTPVTGGSTGWGLPAGAEDPGVRLPILARTAQGYRDLCKALSAYALSHPGQRDYAYDVEELARFHTGNWLILTGTARGPLRRAMRAATPSDRHGEALRMVDYLRELFGSEHVAIESHLLPSDTPIVGESLAQIAQQRDLPLVATGAAYADTPRRAALADVLTATRLRQPLAKIEQHLSAGGRFLRSPTQMLHIHRAHPHAVHTAARLGTELAFDLRLLAPELPTTRVPKGHTDASWLRELTYRGAHRAYGPRESHPHAWQVIDKELRVIENLGFPGYFLIVKDIVDFCARNGIWCQGRGSAANSAVCYALNITAVDAVRHRMLFERFLSEGRSGPPDIDIDIESDRREEVIHYVYDTYGRENAAQVGTVMTYRPRSAIYDAARALGYDEERSRAWAQGVSRWMWHDGIHRIADLAEDAHTVSTPTSTLSSTPSSTLSSTPSSTLSSTPSSTLSSTPSGVPAPHDAPREELRPVGVPAPERSTPQDASSQRSTPQDRTQQAHTPERSTPQDRTPQAHTPQRSTPQRTTPQDPTLQRTTPQDPSTARPHMHLPLQVGQIADALRDLPRHTGIHSGGMVLTRTPVSEICPVMWAATPGRTVLQWDKEDCADAGLVKFDLLGLGMLSALRRAFTWLEEAGLRSTDGRPFGLHHLPAEDPAVYDLLCAADAIGVFQVESRAQLNTLPRMQPRCFYDLVIEVALIRPGPIQGQSVNPYLRRRRGEEDITYPHELLRPALEKTLGVPLFQEQLMQIAVDIAGFTAAEADELRRAMGAKRSGERMRALEPRLLEGMAHRGIVGDIAHSIVDKLHAFADFGFPESHSFSFAFLVYASAWLKVHAPEFFYAGIIASQPMGFYSVSTLVHDARRHGVRVARPDVNYSQVLTAPRRITQERTSHEGTSPVPTSDPRSTQSRESQSSNASPLGERRWNRHVHTCTEWEVRLGLHQVSGLKTAVAERIVEARADGPFTSVNDCVARCHLSVDDVQILAKSGALTSIELRRRQAMWLAGQAVSRRVDDNEQQLILPGLETVVASPEFVPLSVAGKIVADYSTLGVSTVGHPFSVYRPVLAQMGVREAVTIGADDHGRIVEVAGVITHRQSPATGKGIVFLSVEDETGLSNITCSQGMWKRYRGALSGAAAVRVRGMVEHGNGAISILAHHIDVLPDAGGVRASAKGGRGGF